MNHDSRRRHAIRPLKRSTHYMLSAAALMIAATPLTLLYLAFSLWWGNEDVVSTQPLGAFVHMSAPGGMTGRVVIETERGFLPLKDAVAIATGTPLVLELRGSGRRYVCDRPPTFCVETEKEGFAARLEGGRP